MSSNGYTSLVPKYKFSSTLKEQESELKHNPLTARMADARRKLSSDKFRPIQTNSDLFRHIRLIGIGRKRLGALMGGGPPIYTYIHTAQSLFFPFQHEQLKPGMAKY